MTSLRWSYGVTTVPSRVETLLPASLMSLEAAGFDKPRIFLDGGTHSLAQHVSDSHKGEIVLRIPSIGAYGNWILALWELYIREPAADRYAIFQDDITAYRNLRQYLNHQPFPDGRRDPCKGYWNLYTVTSNQEEVPYEDYQGWFMARTLNQVRPDEKDTAQQKGAGALGLVFDREGVQTLIHHQHMILKPSDASAYPKRRIDGAVVDAMNAAGYREYVHSPSLVQHTGSLCSTIGTQPRKLAPNWLGEDYDALLLLQPRG